MKNKLIMILVVFLFLLSGCQSETTNNEIELYTNKSDIKVDLEGKDSPRKIKVALASVISPKASLSKYNYLFEYISSEMGVTIEIIQKQTYQEVDNMLKAGEVDFAFICSLSYVIGLKEQYLVDVAAPVVSGQPLYKSYTIVNQNSPYESLVDLQGKKFAYSDPYSYTGRLSILSQLNKLGKNPSAAHSYHKELERSTGEISDNVKELLPRLRNQNETEIVITTLPEATPVLEAQRLQQDLKRAGITPHWWIINQSLFASNTVDPILSGRASSEERWIKKVQNELSTHMAVIPWLESEIVGINQIEQLLK